MVRISRLSDYGIQLLAELTRAPQRESTARDLAGCADIPAPTVRKLLKALSRAGLLVSRRGVAGGYRLARTPEEISIAEIIEAIEGPVALTDCSLPGGDGCERQETCQLKANWQSVNQLIHGALARLTLSQMVGLPTLWRTSESGGSP